MTKIKCKEPGCPRDIPNPCQKITSYLGLISKLGIETSRSQGVSLNDLTEEIRRKRQELKDIGVVKVKEELESDLKEGKHVSLVNRTLTLQCLNGHRHNYEVTCKN